MDSKIVVSRKWNEPQILVRFCDKEIGIEMNIDDFLHALCIEAGNPAMTVTIKGLESKLKKAVGAVVLEMKLQSVK